MVCFSATLESPGTLLAYHLAEMLHQWEYFRCPNHNTPRAVIPLCPMIGHPPQDARHLGFPARPLAEFQSWAITLDPTTETPCYDDRSGLRPILHLLGKEVCTIYPRRRPAARGEPLNILLFSPTLDSDEDEGDPESFRPKVLPRPLMSIPSPGHSCPTDQSHNTSSSSHTSSMTP